MSIGIFLVLVLFGAILLFALVSAPRGGRRRGGYNSGHRSGHNSNRHPVQTLSREQIYARWQTIRTMADTGGGNGLRQAVSEADKLLDQAMLQQGAQGDSMADRLRSVQNRFSDRNSVWRAHKVRNALAHEIGYDLVPAQAKEVISDFERALKDLGAL
jgi:hypothetical protein